MTWQPFSQLYNHPPMVIIFALYTGTMSFVFVQNSTVHDVESRKLIRSHCMRGKNAGKSRARTRLSKNQNMSGALTVRLETENNENVTALPESPSRDRFASVLFPSHLDKRMQYLLYRCGLP